MTLPTISTDEDAELPDFLSGLFDDEIQTIFSYAQARCFASGTFAIRRGDRDRSLHIVTKGVFEVLLTTPNGPLSILELRAGDIFGDMAFFDGMPRSANVQTVEDGETLVMTPDGFDRLRLAEPRLAVRFLMDLGRILSARIRAVNRRLASALAVRDLIEGTA